MAKVWANRCTYSEGREPGTHQEAQWPAVSDQRLGARGIEVEPGVRREYRERIEDWPLLELLPVDVTEIMVQRIEKEDDYKTVKEKVMRYVEQREEFGSTFPMDCSHIDDVDQSHMDGNNHNNLNHGTDEEINWIGKGTKGGKGGKGFTGQCHTCGEFGHRPPSALRRMPVGSVVM